MMGACRALGGGEHRVEHAVDAVADLTSSRSKGSMWMSLARSLTAWKRMPLTSRMTGASSEASSRSLGSSMLVGQRVHPSSAIPSIRFSALSEPIS